MKKKNNNIDSSSKINTWFYDGKMWNITSDMFVRLLNNALDYTLKENKILIDELEKNGIEEKKIVELLQPNVDAFNAAQKELFDKNK